MSTCCEIYLSLQARTKGYYDYNLEQLGEENPRLFEWLQPTLPQCAAFPLLQKGVKRRGLATPNPNGQFNSAILPDRDLPVAGLIAAVLSKMGDYTYLRRTLAKDRS